MIKRLWKWLTEKEYRIASTDDLYYRAESRSKIFPIWIDVPGTVSRSPSDAGRYLKVIIRANRYPKYKQYLGSEDAIMRSKDE